MKNKQEKRYTEGIRKDILIWIGSWAIVWLIFMIWDVFSELVKFNWFGAIWALLIKVVISSVWIYLVIIRFEKVKFK